MSSLLFRSLRLSSIRLDLSATTKEDAIHELIGVLDQSEGLPDPGEAERVVLVRERSMSTGMNEGLALPHGKTDTVDHLMMALAVKREGIDFGSPDGTPAQLIVLMLSPASRSGPHIQLLAEVSTILRVPAAREEIIACECPRDIMTLLTERTWR